MTKRVLAGLIATLSIGGCAITSGYGSGPHGKPVYFIDGMTAGVAYRKAEAKCPNGYDIVGEPRQTSLVDYKMTVECK